MQSALEIRETETGRLAVAPVGGGELWSYAYRPGTPANESPRPFMHPLHTRHGDVLTNWRPNDHPWHHGLSFTLTSVNGVNFWGGPSHRAADGYQWRQDHGVQQHDEWLLKTPARLVQRLTWLDSQPDAAVVLTEERTLATTLRDDGWTLQWISRLTNPGSFDLRCDNYHSLGGLDGSHYSGLQFRGARGLLDQHGDATIRVVGEGGQTELEALHGHTSNWVEWHAQHDGSLRRTRLRFESKSGPLPWFVRPNDPMVAWAPHRENAWIIPAGETRELDHELHIFDA
ncbi:PmoA family protein [Synoicihabitans lomoniglobus]|uniref:PmoA family protein n=1 Tax=Synoicihabitans lomoniglobus TaxID=2909285 RepID=A0AAF0I5C7_9BACT|nr:PmoA family protein [Opitutaceae bacterium LMO-M01]WED66975.1 PmoA family protein [Opitutaceae bacterium LMO-M01]